MFPRVHTSNINKSMFIISWDTCTQYKHSLLHVMTKHRNWLVRQRVPSLPLWNCHSIHCQAVFLNPRASAALWNIIVLLSCPTYSAKHVFILIFDLLALKIRSICYDINQCTFIGPCEMNKTDHSTREIDWWTKTDLLLAWPDSTHDNPLQDWNSVLDKLFLGVVPNWQTWLMIDQVDMRQVLVAYLPPSRSNRTTDDGTGMIDQHSLHIVLVAVAAVVVDSWDTCRMEDQTKEEVADKEHFHILFEWEKHVRLMNRRSSVLHLPPYCGCEGGGGA